MLVFVRKKEKHIMKKMQKFLALGLSVVLMASLTACGTSSQGTSDKSSQQSSLNEDAAVTPEADDEPDVSYEKCELTFSWWGDETTNEKTLAAIEAFEAKYPGITINESFSIWNGWEDSMASQFEAGITPDVNQIDWSWIHTYSSNGETFLDLNTVSDVLELTQIDQKYLDMCTVADELQAVPVSMTGKIFYWDKTTFDKAGIAVPTTLTDLIAAGTTFQEELGKAYYPLALDEDDKMALMVYYLESVYGKAWVENNKLNYTVEEIQTGLEFIQSLETAHVIPSSEELAKSNFSSLTENVNWVKGKYAGVFGWDYEADDYESSLKKGREFVVGEELKDMGEYQGGFSKISMGYAIAESCEHPKEAALFIDFLLNQNAGTTIIGSERGIPLSKSALENCTAQGIINENVLEANIKVLDYVTFEMDPKFEHASLAGTNGIYYDVMAGLSYGEYDVPTAAQVLYDDVTTMFKDIANTEQQ